MDINVLTLRHPIVLLRLAVRKMLRVLRKEEPVVKAPEPTPVTAPPADDFIDVRQLIASTSMEALHEKAETYFSSLTDWDHHLAKPFSTVSEAPALLINFATMLQGMRLFPGLRVVDFGGGTGWASRYLTQLGCEVILVDVSKTALDIARELYRRHPPIGKRPEPRFLHYNGTRLDLGDESVDRILCFDAFHHATNPDEVIRDFARVLVPGGIAAFAEPGPHHSKFPNSQFEMRTYGVVENDVDVHAIWKTAQEAGFVDIKFAAYNIPPYQIDLAGYDDLLNGGENYLRWAEFTRYFMRDVRNFFLKKAGDEPVDSRQTAGLAATIEISMPSQVAAGEKIAVHASITNSGRALWLPSAIVPGGVSLGSHLYDGDGKLVTFDHDWQPLSDERTKPGESVTLDFALPPLAAGSYIIEFDCVSNGVCWFAQMGSRAVRAAVEVKG